MRAKKLSPEDQEKVDNFISTGYNDVERKPFRPFLLLLGLIVILSIFSGVSYLIAFINGAV